MDPVDVILISDPGSRRHGLASGRLMAQGITPSLCPAVILEEKAARQAVEYDDEMRKAVLGYALTKGEIGCFLAHRNAWRKASSNRNPTLILEDDAFICDDLMGRLASMADCLSETPMVIRLFSSRHSNSRTWKDCGKGLKIARPCRAGYSTVAYFLSAQAAKALLAGSTRFWQTVDDYMDDERRSGVIVMQTVPQLATHHDDGMSMIGLREKPAADIWTRIRRESIRACRNLAKYLHRRKVRRELFGE